MRTAAISVLALIALPGCAQWKATARINPSTVAVYSDVREQERATLANAQAGDLCPLTGGRYDGKIGAINLDCFKFPEDRGFERTNSLTAYQRAAGRRLTAEMPAPLSATERAEATAARNRLGSILIKHADDVCVLEKGRLVATESSVNFTLSLLTQGFAGASTIVSGELAKSILSGIATLTSGTQSNVNATFYRNQLIQAINKTLDAERDRIMRKLVSDRERDILSYNVDDMIASANAYHQACSFERGLQVLLDAALDKSGANAVLETRSRDAAIAELEALIGKIDVELAKKGLGDDARAALQKQRSDAVARRTGLVMARTDKLVVNPSAGDTPDPKPEVKK